MAQFDVHRNGNPGSADEFPLLLDVQADLHDGLRTRLVVPLARLDRKSGPIIKDLMPLLTVAGVEYAMITPQAAGIATRLLGERVDNLSARRQDIIAALDLLLTGL